MANPSLEERLEQARATEKLKRDAGLALEYVEVRDEPYHQFIFENQWVRLYTVTLPPGATTLYHRHAEDTVYVILQGGGLCTELPGKQKQKLRFARSIGLVTKIRWGLSRLLRGIVELPRSTVFVQYNRKLPMIHRVSSGHSNRDTVKMIGIEVLKQSGGPLRAVRESAARLECTDPAFEVRRLRLEPRQTPEIDSTRAPRLVIVIAGRAEMGDGASLESGDFRWFDADEAFELRNVQSEELEALIVSLKTRPAD